MLSLRLVCSRLQPRVATRMATTTAAPTVTRTSSSSSESPIPLANVEAQWERLTAEEQLTVHRQLEDLQKKDWKQLTLDEKKAGASFALAGDSKLLNEAFMLSILYCVRPSWSSRPNKTPRGECNDNIRCSVGSWSWWCNLRSHTGERCATVSTLDSPFIT